MTTVTPPIAEPEDEEMLVPLQEVVNAARPMEVVAQVVSTVESLPVEDP